MIKESRRVSVITGLKLVKLSLEERHQGTRIFRLSRFWSLFPFSSSVGTALTTRVKDSAGIHETTV